MPRFIGLAVGAMFFVMGNVLGKLRPNWFFGVRTPWTLSSKLSWNKTHRLAGWVFVLGGLLLMAAGLVGTPTAMGIAFAVLMAGVLGAVTYSYFVWRSDPDRVPPAGTLPANDDAGPGGNPPKPLSDRPREGAGRAPRRAAETKPVKDLAGVLAGAWFVRCRVPPCPIQSIAVFRRGPPLRCWRSSSPLRPLPRR